MYKNIRETNNYACFGGACREALTCSFLYLNLIHYQPTTFQSNFLLGNKLQTFLTLIGKSRKKGRSVHFVLYMKYVGVVFVGHILSVWRLVFVKIMLSKTLGKLSKNSIIIFASFFFPPFHLPLQLKWVGIGLYNVSKSLDLEFQIENKCHACHAKPVEKWHGSGKEMKKAGEQKDLERREIIVPAGPTNLIATGKNCRVCNNMHFRELKKD